MNGTDNDNANCHKTLHI